MSPARMRRMVDLPQPDGPRRATISLGRIAKLMSSKTRNGLPLGSGNSCHTPRTSQSASHWPLTVDLSDIDAGSSLDRKQFAIYSVKIVLQLTDTIVSKLCD